MKNWLKLLASLLLFIPALAGADNAGMESAITIGTGFSGLAGSSIDQLDNSSATRRNAYGFQAPISGTIDQVCVFVSNRTGTPGATDGVLDIFSDATAKPNASLSSGTFSVASTGFKCSTQNQAVTAGTQYWFQVTNANGTPTSNYFGIWQAPENIVDHHGGTNGTQLIGPSMCRSVDNGATWADLNRVYSAAYRVHYAAGTYFGFPATSDDSPTNPIASADRVYSTNEVGNKFTTPTNIKPNLRCVSFRAAKAIGTPTGFVVYKLYSGITLVDTTAQIGLVSDLSSPGGVKLCFSVANTLSASTVYRVSMAETTQSDASSDAYGPHRIDWDSTSASLALKPFNGTLSKTVCASSCNGGTWTDTTTSWYQMQLFLDPGNEFAGIGGGILNLNNVNASAQVQ